MKRALLVLLLASVAHAEGGWLTARGRLQPELRLEAWGSTDSAGAGFVLPDETARAAWSAELGYAYFNRVFEARGNRVWQVVPTKFATISFTAGALMHVVPEGVFDFGFGPVAGFNLSLGGNTVTVDLGLLSSIEAFVAQFYTRFPQRLQLSLNVRAGPLVFGLHARAGVDLSAEQLFVMKGELALTFGWLKMK
jgi:hypothetical protein